MSGKPRPVTFAGALGEPEGPVVLKDGSWLVVEMRADRGCVTHLSCDGRTRRHLARTGRPNGLAVAADGTIWVAESQSPSLIVLDPGGGVISAASRLANLELLFPNDLCFGPDGTLYLTDSGIHVDEFAPGGQVRPDWLDLQMDGRVFRVDPQTLEAVVLDRGLRFPNGIAFGPDGALYVNETMTGDVHRYPAPASGNGGGRQRFGNVVDARHPAVVKGPDGMAFAADGRLFVTVVGQGDVAILSSDGRLADRLPVSGGGPTNVAFGLHGDGRIYITEVEHGRLEMLDVGVDGLELHRGPERDPRDAPAHPAGPEPKERNA